MVCKCLDFPITQYLFFGYQASKFFFPYFDNPEKSLILSCWHFIPGNGYWKNEKWWVKLKYNFVVFTVFSCIVQYWFEGDQLTMIPKDFQTHERFTKCNAICFDFGFKHTGNFYPINSGNFKCLWESGCAQVFCLTIPDK